MATLWLHKAEICIVSQLIPSQLPGVRWLQPAVITCQADTTTNHRCQGCQGCSINIFPSTNNLAITVTKGNFYLLTIETLRRLQRKARTTCEVTRKINMFSTLTFKYLNMNKVVLPLLNISKMLK